MLSHFTCARLFVAPWMNHSPPGASVHGILQASIMECVAMPFSRGSSPYREQILISMWQAGSLPLAPPGKLKYFKIFFSVMVYSVIGHMVFRYLVKYNLRVFVSEIRV